jgi:cation:H+ antiporter
MSALRKQNEVALGNVIGSNIFNSLGILGITAIVKPVPVSVQFLHLDLPMMVASAVLLTLLVFTRPKIGRIAALCGLLGYAVYISYIAGLWSLS